MCRCTKYYTIGRWWASMFCCYSLWTHCCCTCCQKFKAVYLCSPGAIIAFCDQDSGSSLSIQSKNHLPNKHHLIRLGSKTRRSQANSQQPHVHKLNQADIYVINETWLKDDRLTPQIPGYFSFRLGANPSITSMSSHSVEARSATLYTCLVDMLQLPHLTALYTSFQQQTYFKEAIHVFQDIRILAEVAEASIHGQGIYIDWPWWFQCMICL